MTLGIIDVGTNSIHLLIGILGLDGKFHIILKERDLTRLGEDGLANNALMPKAMWRAKEVLKRYAALIRQCGVDHVEAVTTSAVREARNGRAFVRQVRSQLSIPLRIISGREEARLIYLGVLQAHRFRRTTAIITIGGGSAQVMHGSGTRLKYVGSVPLGGARLAQRFIHHDPPFFEECAALSHEAWRVWAPSVRVLRRYRWHEVLGSSATIYQLMLAAYLQTHRHNPKHKQHRLTMSQQALRRLVAWLSASTAKERIQLSGLDPRREDLALPTGIVLLTWMEECGVKRLRYASGSLREGLVIDYLIRHHQRMAGRMEHPLAEWVNANSEGELLPLRHPVLFQRIVRPRRQPKEQHRR